MVNIDRELIQIIRIVKVVEANWRDELHQFLVQNAFYRM